MTQKTFLKRVEGLVNDHIHITKPLTTQPSYLAKEGFYSSFPTTLCSYLKFLEDFSFIITLGPFLVGFIRNKRAQRALGRSPEEKVKGHSGAIYRGSLMLSTKYW